MSSRRGRCDRRPGFVLLFDEGILFDVSIRGETTRKLRAAGLPENAHRSRARGRPALAPGWHPVSSAYPGPTMRLILIAAAVALAGCGSGLQRAAAVVATPDANGCTTVDPAAPKNVHATKPKRRLDPHRVYIATVVTNCGSFQIRLAVKRAPK